MGERRFPARWAVAGLTAAVPFAAWALHRAHPRPGHPYLGGAPLLIAHRGGLALAPENTILAFDRALRWWRADLLELDVHPTRDGEAVVIHDGTIDRTTDSTGRVADLPLQQLQRADAGYHFTPDGGHTFPFRGRGIAIPTLGEVLHAFPAARVNVEIKDGRAQERVWEVVHEARAAHRVLITAEKRRDRSRFDDYTGPTSASAEEMRAFYLRHRIRAAHLYVASADAFQMPERHAGRQVLSPRFVADAHDKNIAVHVWTVNEPADMRRLLDYGVDGIVSDRPDLVAEVLAERGSRPSAPGPAGDDVEPFLERLLRT